MSTPDEHDITLWKSYIQAYDAFLTAGRRFNSEVSNKVSILKFAFANGESRLALEIAKLLSEDDKKLCLARYLD